MKFTVQVVLTPTHLAIVMEYAAGGELFDRICSAGRFSEDEVASVLYLFYFRVPCESLYQPFFEYLMSRETSLFLCTSESIFSFHENPLIISFLNTPPTLSLPLQVYPQATTISFSLLFPSLHPPLPPTLSELYLQFFLTSFSLSKHHPIPVFSLPKNFAKQANTQLARLPKPI